MSITIRLLILLPIVVLFLGNPCIAQTRDINATVPMSLGSAYCKGEISWEDHTEYDVDLLRLALSLSDSDIKVRPSCAEYPTEQRRIAMLQSGDEINVVFFGTNAEREEKLLPVYVPIYMGTTGLRLFMTQPKILHELNDIESLQELKKFTMGQGIGWPDGDTLRLNGFSVTDGRYMTLHKMLNAQRFDLYPRAYWQIVGEWQWMRESAPNIIISDKIALYYPQPIYFFVSPKAPELHKALQIGMERAFDTGLLWDLLQTHPETAPSFQKLNLKDLRIFRIENPLLPEKSVEAMKKYSMFQQRRVPEGDSPQ